MSITLNYKDIGEGKPTLIIHGLFGSLDNWQTMARRMSEQGLRVVTADLRNHGKSPHTDEMSLELMAEDVAHFIQEHDLIGCTLIGHSMGGKTAMHLALTRPDLIDELVVVDIAPKPYPPHHNRYFEAMLGLDLAKVESRRDAKEILSQNVKSQAVLQFLLKNLDRLSDGSYAWKFNLPVLYENYEGLVQGIVSLNSFVKPTLFIDGQLSDYVTPADHAQILTLFPQAKIETIKNAGHWVHAEAPDAFLDQILQFVKS